MGMQDALSGMKNKIEGLEMAIHAKKNGLLIGGKIVMENEAAWIFQAMDNKRPTVVDKNSTKEKVFDGDGAVDAAINWIGEVRKKK